MASKIEALPGLLRIKDAGRLQLHIGLLLDFCYSNAGDAKVVKHPLGFINYPVLESDDCTLRLHIWPDGVNQLEFIHNHARELTSYILIGSIRNLMYDVDIESEHPSHRLAEVRYQGLCNVIEATKTTVSCCLKSDDLHGIGDVYEISVGAFHSASVEARGYTATLALSGPKIREQPQILVDLSTAGLTEIVRKEARVEETRQWIAGLRKEWMRAGQIG